MGRPQRPDPGVTGRANLDEPTFRHPTDADHGAIVDAVDGWWGERARSARPPRWWLRHAASTSWIAETADGRLVGFAFGLRSPDEPAEALLLAVAVMPGKRRAGLGRALVERLADVVTQAGAARLVAEAWPGNPGAIRFLEALGFEPDVGRGSQRLFGTPAWPDYDGPGEDRAVLRRSLPLA
jgi:GNAT superfamily N-acetyltransferase